MNLDKKFAQYKKKKKKSVETDKPSTFKNFFKKSKVPKNTTTKKTTHKSKNSFSFKKIFHKSTTKKTPKKETPNHMKALDKKYNLTDKKKFSFKDLIHNFKREKSEPIKEPNKFSIKKLFHKNEDKKVTPKHMKHLDKKYNVDTDTKKKFKFKDFVQKFKKKDSTDELEKKIEAEKADLNKPTIKKEAKEGFFTKLKHQRSEKKSKKNLEEKPVGKKKDKADVKEQDIRKLFKKQAKDKKQKLTAAERKRRLSDYLEKSGLEIDQVLLSKKIFYIAIGLTSLLTIVYVYMSVLEQSTILGIFGQVLIIWIFGFVSLWGASWIVFRIYLDLLMFNRKLSLEEVLPDFLQLTSANLRAGMPIDRALWFAVRPRFGVLAKEIEDTAKRTLSGEDLHEALLNFAKKYDSQILTRSIYLLNEGMDAGGDVGDLLNKIALNIQEMRAMKKEMAANVTTYVIFISFAAMLAAPFLFGLSAQLLSVVQSIAGNVAGSSGGGTATSGGIGLTINLSEDAIKMGDYQIFAYISLSVSSIFSGIIVAAIKKGNVKEGLHYIPMFLIVALLAYFIATKLLGMMFSGMF